MAKDTDSQENAAIDAKRELLSHNGYAFALHHIPGFMDTNLDWLEDALDQK